MQHGSLRSETNQDDIQRCQRSPTHELCKQWTKCAGNVPAVSDVLSYLQVPGITHFKSGTSRRRQNFLSNVQVRLLAMTKGRDRLLVNRDVHRLLSLPTAPSRCERQTNIKLCPVRSPWPYRMSTLAVIIKISN